MAGGSIAATMFESQQFFRVNVISAVGLIKKTSEGDSHQGGKNNQSESKEKGFKALFQTELEKSQPVDIDVHQTGYTKTGMPSAVFIKMREYQY